MSGRKRPPALMLCASLLAGVPAAIISEERPGRQIIGMVLLGARSTIYTAVHGGGAAAPQQHRCPGVRARRRRGPAAVQDIIVGIVKREQTWLLDSRLREYRRCECERQNGCRAECLESGHSLSSSVNRLGTRFGNSRLLRL